MGSVHDVGVRMDVGTISVNGRDLFHIESPRRVVTENKPLTTLSERKDEPTHRDR